MTLPTSTDTLVGRDTTDTLTNKTLTSPKINDTTTITSTGAEINLLDGSSPNTVVNSKAVIYGSAGELTSASLKVTTGAQSNYVLTSDANGNATWQATQATGSAEKIFEGLAKVECFDNTNDDYITFETCNDDTTAVERMRITSAGNVGIGTANPSGGKLQVENTSGTALRIISNTSQIGFSMGGTGRFNIDASGVIAGRFTVLDSGNVGIGAVSPSEKLDIVGSIKFGDGTNSTKFSAASSGNDLAYTLPSSTGSSGQILQMTEILQQLYHGEQYHQVQVLQKKYMKD